MTSVSAAELGSRGQGLSRALLDYWERCGILTPAKPGRYSSVEASIALVLADASKLGVPGAVLCSLAELLASKDDPLCWPRALWASANGELLEEEPAGPAWLLRPLERGCDFVVLAATS